MPLEYIVDIIIAAIAIVVPFYALWKVNKNEAQIRQDKLNKEKHDHDEAETEKRFLPYKQEITDLHGKVMELEKALKQSNEGVNELKDKRIAVLEARIINMDQEITVLKKRRTV